MPRVSLMQIEVLEPPQSATRKRDMLKEMREGRRGADVDKYAHCDIVLEDVADSALQHMVAV